MGKGVQNKLVAHKSLNTKHVLHVRVNREAVEESLGVVAERSFGADGSNCVGGDSYTERSLSYTFPAPSVVLQAQAKWRKKARR
jgi:hypothetical protein